MNDLSPRLKPYALALLLALLASTLGFGLGIVFGAAESALKGRMTRSTEPVLQQFYAGDTKKAKAAVGKAFRYIVRAHLHSGVLGACALSMILLLALLGEPSLSSRIAGHFLGLGALVYGSYWLLAGLYAPQLGGTAAAKNTFELLGMGGGGLLMLGLLGVIGVAVNRLLLRR